MAGENVENSKRPSPSQGHGGLVCDDPPPVDLVGDDWTDNNARQTVQFIMHLISLDCVII